MSIEEHDSSIMLQPYKEDMKSLVNSGMEMEESLCVGDVSTYGIKPIPEFQPINKKYSKTSLGTKTPIKRSTQLYEDFITLGAKPEELMETSIIDKDECLTPAILWQFCKPSDDPSS